MYIPEEYVMESPEEIVGFMQQYNFGCLVGLVNNKLTATHLPFIVQYEPEHLVLLTHLAKDNPQAHQLEHQEVLVIFAEPHAYISPTWYASSPNVPTWNYVAVHAYAKVRVLDTAATQVLMEQTVKHFEPQHKEQFWDKLPPNYRKGLLADVVALELVVHHVEAKKKLSQNKHQQDIVNVIDALQQTEDGLAHQIAAMMHRELPSHDR